MFPIVNFIETGANISEAPVNMTGSNASIFVVLIPNYITLNVTSSKFLVDCFSHG